MVAKWQYLSVRSSINDGRLIPEAEQGIFELGREGWEMVSTVLTTMTIPRRSSGSDSPKPSARQRREPALLIFFKRPVVPDLPPPPTAKDLEGTGLYL